MPAILEESVSDERVPVTVDEAYTRCASASPPPGSSSGSRRGAYLAGIEHIARRERRGRFVTLFNDLGERYFSTRLRPEHSRHAITSEPS